jgi:hypothetical protein
MSNRKSKGKGAAKRATKPAKAEARIPLKKICADLGIEPKAARVKLRRIWRREESPGVSFHTKGSRWDLTPAQAKEVRAHLGG